MPYPMLLKASTPPFPLFDFLLCQHLFDVLYLLPMCVCGDDVWVLPPFWAVFVRVFLAEGEPHLTVTPSVSRVMGCA